MQSAGNGNRAALKRRPRPILSWESRAPGKGLRDRSGVDQFTKVTVRALVTASKVAPEPVQTIAAK